MPIVLARVAACTGVRRRTPFYGVVRFGITSGPAGPGAHAPGASPQASCSLQALLGPAFFHWAVREFGSSPGNAHVLRLFPTVWWVLGQAWTTPGGHPARPQRPRQREEMFGNVFGWVVEAPQRARIISSVGWAEGRAVTCAARGRSPYIESYSRCSLPVDTINTGRATLFWAVASYTRPYMGFWSFAWAWSRCGHGIQLFRL